MSTLVTMPYRKWDAFTELWLCNPALGLADPERVPEQPEGSPEPPVEGPITGPSSRGVPSFGPCSALLARLLLPGVEGIATTTIPRPCFGQACCLEFSHSLSNQ